jgi:cellulose synthase/poly-beta-1,6-N-acetylglucosamine synthase-like glycosyltransferase
VSWANLVLGVYLSILGLLSLHGLHRLWMVWAFGKRTPHPARSVAGEPPRVTVQLPMFNEPFVARRLILAAGGLRHPPGLLEIQVLDDSTDDTTGIAQQAVDELVARGVDAVLLHRTDRTGFKAGALNDGTRVAKGEFLAVFDADFVPPPDVPRDTLPWFAAGVGMVQARWGHLNAERSWLTRRPGHAARRALRDRAHGPSHVAGRWFNFNGTAEIWRREAIAGGRLATRHAHRRPRPVVPRPARRLAVRVPAGRRGPRRAAPRHDVVPATTASVGQGVVQTCSQAARADLGV